MRKLINERKEGSVNVMKVGPVDWNIGEPRRQVGSYLLPKKTGCKLKLMFRPLKKR